MAFSEVNASGQWEKVAINTNYDHMTNYRNKDYNFMSISSYFFMNMFVSMFVKQARDGRLVMVNFMCQYDWAMEPRYSQNILDVSVRVVLEKINI